MTEEYKPSYPKAYLAIEQATQASRFSMASDALTGSLLRTLAGTKPAGAFLELGTGTGLSTSWILAGMDEMSTLVSVDTDAHFLTIAQHHLSYDLRLKLVCEDGGTWLEQNQHRKFDYIFADTWHGKYLLLEETLAMLNPGGLYILDDMLPQPNWPEGHQEKAFQLLQALERRRDLLLTQQKWASGIVIAVKKSGRSCYS